MDEIRHISDYIRAIETITADIGKNKTIVFRGEIEKFSKPCYPNLFRQRILERNPYFEKNQLDEMAANHLTNGETYLEKAIDAQHGGFPSRLLDVTYNCLIALYFAVTPFYHEEEESTDCPGKDAMVYIFPMERMYCPTANNIIDAYQMIVSDRNGWLNKETIFQKNHKLIDHIKLNPRIIAQQGAFILFQGEEGEEIPPYQYKSIQIKGENKKILREELRELCGIYTGSVYPENFNTVKEIIRKTNYVNTKEFEVQTELELARGNLKRCLDYYQEVLENEGDSREKFLDILIEAESNIRDYRDGILDLSEGEQEGYKGDEKFQIAVRETREYYNELVEEFYRELEQITPEGIEFMQDSLML